MLNLGRSKFYTLARREPGPPALTSSSKGDNDAEAGQCFSDLGHPKILSISLKMQENRKILIQVSQQFFFFFFVSIKQAYLSIYTYYNNRLARRPRRDFVNFKTHSS